MDKNKKNKNKHFVYATVLVVAHQSVQQQYQQLLETLGFLSVESLTRHQAMVQLPERSQLPSLILFDFPAQRAFRDEILSSLEMWLVDNKIPTLFIVERSKDFLEVWEEGDIPEGIFDYLCQPLEPQLVAYKARMLHQFYQQRTALEWQERDIRRFSRQLEQIQHERQFGEGYLDGIFSSIVEPLVMINAEGVIGDCNPALSRLTGIPYEELVDSTLWDLTEKKGESGATSQVQERLCNFQSRVQSILDQEPISLTNLCNEAPIATMLVDHKGHVLFCNSKMEQLSGWTGEELMGGPLDRLLPPGVRESHRDLIASYMHNPTSRTMGKDRVLPLWTANNEERMVEVGLLPLQIGGTPQVLVILHDSAEEYQWELFQMSTLGTLFVEEEEEEVFISDIHGERIPVRLSGGLLYSSRREVIGAVIVLYDLRERIKVEQAARESAYFSGISEISSHILHNFGNAVASIRFFVHALVSARDKLQQLTSLLNLEQEKMDQGGQSELTFALLGSALKDFNSAYLSDDLDGAERTINHMSEILEAQRSMVRVESPLWASQFSLQEGLDTAITITREQMDRSRVIFEYSFDESIDQVLLPKNPLQQMVINLLKNAVEAIDDRYQLEADRDGVTRANEVVNRIWMSVKPTSCLVVQGEEELPAFEIVVEDNGIGLPDQKQQVNVFAPGYTTKQGGSGQGLHSAANFVASVSGTIVLESREEGEGARFRVCLPMEKKGAN